MRTKEIGKEFIELASTASTNKSAADLLRRSKLRHGAVILAHDQTAGIGQRGRTWQSGAGLDLTFSIVVTPLGLKTEEQFVLSKLITVALQRVLHVELSGPVKIKWPNDILVDRRKIAGVLIQNEIHGDTIKWSIIGVGLNVNSINFEEGLMATSMALEAGKNFDRLMVLEEICVVFEELWQEWQDNGGSISEEYAAHLWSKGRWAEVDLDGAKCMVRPMDVDAAGQLFVEKEDGSVGAYNLERLRFAAR